MNEGRWVRKTDRSLEPAKASKPRAGWAKQAWMGRSFLGLGLGAVLVFAFSMAGCHKTAAASAQSAVDQNAGDPADANMASGNDATQQQPARVLGERAQNESQQRAEDYSQGAPIERRQSDQGADNSGYNNGSYVSDDEAADVYAADLTADQTDNPPPPLPDYDQPPAPDEDYLWTPGYWAWSPMGYYWVPGCWVAAPYEGALWTPGYWGFFGGHYRFHHGYWGLHIGFYGGVDYGYGYVGHGYYGGYWNHNHFFYNTSITRVNGYAIHNVYVHPVMVNNVVITGRIGNRVSFVGGRGGLMGRPMPAEIRVMHEQRIPPMESQMRVQHDAAQDRHQFFNENHGRPQATVFARPVSRDHVLPAELPRHNGPVGRPDGHGEVRPGQMQEGHPQYQPERNVPNGYEGRSGGQNRVEPQGRPAQPQYQPQERHEQVQPQQQGRPAQPQSQMRQGQPQPEVRPVQPQQQPQQQQQTRPAQPQSQMRPSLQQPEVRPIQPQTRPQEQMRQQEQARPQQQAVPQAQPQAAPAARPQQQAAPAARPQPQARPAQPAHPQPESRPKEDEKPK